MKTVSGKTDCLTGSEVFEKINDQADHSQRYQEEPFPLKKNRYRLEYTFHDEDFLFCG